MDKILLLVISSNQYNYMELFKDLEIKGIKIIVDQCSILDIEVSVYEPKKDNPFGLLVDIRKSVNPFPNSPQEKKRIISPHFLFIRTLCRGMTTRRERMDHRNILFGFMNSGIPSVNSLECIYFNLEKVLVFGELRKIKKKLKDFPLIEQNYHSNSRQIMFPPKYPCVCKIGHVHAGFGKIVVENSERLKDVSSVVALHKDYSTTEEFVDAEYEIRLQKIGKSYRAMKKRLVSGWKSNDFGTSFQEDTSIEKKHVVWLEECGKLFNGMDICALDVLHGKNGKDYILEPIGLSKKFEKIDLQAMKDLVISRIYEYYFPKNTREKKDEVNIVDESKMENVKLRNENHELKQNIKELKEQLTKMNEIYKKKKKKTGLGKFFK